MAEKEANVDKQLHDLLSLPSFTKVRGRKPKVCAMPHSLQVTFVSSTSVSPPAFIDSLSSPRWHSLGHTQLFL